MYAGEWGGGEAGVDGPIPRPVLRGGEKYRPQPDPRHAPSPALVQPPWAPAPNASPMEGRDADRKDGQELKVWHPVEW